MSESDKILIKGLKTSCIIGTLPDERVNKQTVIIDIELSLDLSLAAKTDNLSDTLNYFDLHEEIKRFVEQSEFYLIEKLAQAVADICLDKNQVSKVKVSVSKPEALNHALVAVEIVRKKP